MTQVSHYIQTYIHHTYVHTSYIHTYIPSLEASHSVFSGTVLDGAPPQDDESYSNSFGY